MKDKIERVNESTNRKQHIDECDEEHIGDKSIRGEEVLVIDIGQQYWHTYTVENLTDSDF